MIWKLLLRNGSSTPPLQSSSIPLHRSALGTRVITSAGHIALEPVQASAGSQVVIDVDARHSVPGGRKPSVGHPALKPVQLSATSHTPADGRHTVPDDGAQRYDRPVVAAAASLYATWSNTDPSAFWIPIVALPPVARVLGPIDP
nr:hypothetical protein [Deltaproteobacteria bacterium]